MTAMDAFESLGLPRSLILSEESVREAYRVASKNYQGDEQGFSRLNEAYRTIMSPAARLMHWLELAGMSGDRRGVVAGELLDWFGVVGSVIQETNQLLRKKEQCQSQLARALMESSLQQGREKIERCQEDLRAVAESKIADFPSIESGVINAEQAWICARDLSFLEKWQQQLRERYGKFFS
jgi:hypothetical protein